MGKTILAKLITNIIGGEWYWISFTSDTSKNIESLLRQLESILEEDRIPPNVLLDNIDLSPASIKRFEDIFYGLVYSTIERKGHLIITSQYELPQRFAMRICIDAESMPTVPPFSEDEIADFALLLGCSSKKLAEQWAKIVFLQTKGHPQLIHVRLIKIADNKWPAPQKEDIIGIPREIIEERYQARALLEGLNKDQVKLIYPLSIVGEFRRDHALVIGKIAPSIDNAADAFDRLVGPWIERVNEDYYRISPLLDNVADQVMNEAELNELHSSIAEILFTCGKLTLKESNLSFVHALRSQNPDTLLKIVNRIVFAPYQIWGHIANSMAWYIEVIKLEKTLFQKTPI